MSNRIKVVLRSRHCGEIDFSRDDPFPVPQRTRQYCPERIDDAAAAARYDGLGIGGKLRHIIGRIVATPAELIAGEHEATPFERDVLHR